MNKENICPNAQKCFVLWKNKSKNEAVCIIIPSDEMDVTSYNKFKKDIFDIFKTFLDSEEIIHFRIEELEPIFSEKDEKKLKNTCPCTEKCFFFWKEEPKGKGESAVIIIPLSKTALDSYEAFTNVLLEIFDATTDSEETIYFRIEGLDLFKECIYKS